MTPASLLLFDIQKYISSTTHINSIKYYKDQYFAREKSNLSKILGIDYWQYITDPSLNSSKKTTSDLTEVIRKANNRTKNELDLVWLVDKDPIKLFQSVLQKHNLTFPYLLFDELYTFLSSIIKDLKIYYNRARPNQIADFYGIEIDVVHTKTHHTPSYPSGHTAYASLVASILTEYYPEYTTEFWSIAKKCGEARILQGVHFKEDNIASMNLVQGVYLSLKSLNSHF